MNIVPFLFRIVEVEDEECDTLNRFEHLFWVSSAIDHIVYEAMNDPPQIKHDTLSTILYCCTETPSFKIIMDPLGHVTLTMSIQCRQEIKRKVNSTVNNNILIEWANSSSSLSLSPAQFELCVYYMFRDRIHSRIWEYSGILLGHHWWWSFVRTRIPAMVLVYQITRSDDQSTIHTL